LGDGEWVLAASEVTTDRFADVSDASLPFDLSCAFVPWWDVGLLFRYASRYPLIDLCSSGSSTTKQGWYFGGRK
jgi:hypothetical protein